MNFTKLLEKLDIYKSNYSVFSIGESVLGRKIYAVERLVDRQFPTAFLVAGMHAREHITCDLVCKMLDENLFLKNSFNICVLPMVNPDGVELCINGLKSVPVSESERLLKINGGNYDFSLWKANARGVDINNNFNANFGTNVNSYVPAPSGFIGEHYESEPETKSLVNFTNFIKPFITISYHSKGEEIYYNFFQSGKSLERDSIIAKKFSDSTGYAIKNPENISSGGYKDYCIKQLKIPALTIEVGSDLLSHPIQCSHLDEIYNVHNSVAKDLQFAYNVFMNYEKLL